MSEPRAWTWAQTPNRRRRVTWRRSLAVVAVLALVAGLTCVWSRPSNHGFPRPSTQIGMPAGAWGGPHGSAGATRATSVVPALGAVRWHRSLDTQGAYPPLADELGVYLAFHDRRITAFSAAGEPRWNVATPEDIDAAPVLAGETMVAALRNGMIVAYDRYTGALVWQAETKRQQIASPGVASGVLWTSSLPEIAAVDAATGMVLWESRRGWELRVEAVALAGSNVVVAALKEVLLIDPVTGRQLFFLGISEPRFVAATDRVVVAVSDRNAVAFEPHARRPWWERARGAWNWAYAYQMAPAPTLPPRRWVLQLKDSTLAPALDERRIYLADSAALRAHDLQTGALLWTHQAFPTVAPIVTADGVLLGTREGIRLLDAASGEVLRRWPASPVARGIAVVAGAIYVLSDAEIMAFGPG